MRDDISETEKTVLQATSRILRVSYRGLKPRQRRKLQVSGSQSGSSTLSTSFWENHGDSIISVLETSCGEASLAAKAGITENSVSGGSTKSYYLIFGWRKSENPAQFSSNTLTEMNAATNGVTLYCSKPGRKLMMGAIADLSVLENYLKV